MFLLHQNNVYIKKTHHLPSALIASSKRFDRDVSPVVLKDEDKCNGNYKTLENFLVFRKKKKKQTRKRKKAAAAVTLIAPFVSKKPTKLFKELPFGPLVRKDFTNLKC